MNILLYGVCVCFFPSKKQHIFPSQALPGDAGLHAFGVSLRLPCGGESLVWHRRRIATRRPERENGIFSPNMGGSAEKNGA